MCIKCCSDIRNLASIAKLRSAISEFGSWFSGVCYNSRWSRHAIIPDLHTRWLANTKVNDRYLGGTWVHELLPKIHPEICQGDPFTDDINKEIWDNSQQEISRISEMGSDSGSQPGVPHTKNHLHSGSDPPAFRSGQSDHSPDRREWICDCRHAQPVRCFQGSQAGQFQFQEVLSSQTEVQQLWSGIIGTRGNTEIVAALPWSCHLQGFNSLQPQESRILLEIQSTLQ